MMHLPFLRRLLHRPASRPITHTLVCGASRSGKSEAELACLLPLARQNDCALVLMDPPGTLAAKFLLHLHALGLGGRVIYDRLADTDRVPGYDWLMPSAHTDPLQREAENDERIREFASILLRRRGIQDPATMPLVEETLLAALRLYLCQQTPVPLPWLADVFDRGSPARAHLLAHCTEPALIRKFHEYAALSPTARRTETAPAERILRAVCTSPAFRARSGGATFDFDRFLDERGILLLDGSSRGNLSRDASSVMMGALLLRTIQHCRKGSTSKVVLVLDEAVNGGLVGLHESQALAEAGKWGLECHILIQDPFGFPSAEIRSNVLQNTWRHEWFRQGNPEAARLAAEDIAIPVLDPLRVHHTEYHVRTVETGHERKHAASTSEWSDAAGHVSGSSRSEQTVLVPRRREVRDAQERYTTLTDQILLTQKELMRLQPGYRFVRCDRVTPAPEYVPMLREPAAGRARRDPRRRTRDARGNDAMIDDMLEGMRRRGPFRPALVPLPSAQPPAPRRGAAGRLAKPASQPAE